jgi:hypothetical protein
LLMVMVSMVGDWGVGTGDWGLGTKDWGLVLIYLVPSP